VARLAGAILVCACIGSLAAGSASARSGSGYFALAKISGRADVPTLVSTNWAGYAVADSVGATSSTAFTSVTGTWKQPRATCVAGKTEFSATWVGLGGFSQSSQALEQVGTSADCARTGRPAYYAWYELLPAPSIRVRLKVVPGDTIAASVNVNGTSVLVQLKNRTRHTEFTKRLSMAAPDVTSAEWIEEAPAACISPGNCRVLSLANFGSISIARGATIGSGHPGTISDPAWQATALQLVPAATDAFTSPAGATPSALTADGRGFDVTWLANAATPG
jgi:hypothetical protein